MALFASSLAALIDPVRAHADFGFRSLTSTFTDSDGAGPQRAGAHPISWVTTIELNYGGPAGAEHPEGSLRNLTISLPAGLVGTPEHVPSCSRADFLNGTCPAETRIGSVALATSIPGLPVSELYLLEPEAGIAAQLGFIVTIEPGIPGGSVPVIFDLTISPEPPYNLIASTTNTSQAAELYGSILTLEGSPGGTPFLTLPRSCSAPLSTSFSASPWQAPAVWVAATAPAAQIVSDCLSLSYDPSLSATPTSGEAAAPSGLDLDLDAPDPGITSAAGRAAADTEAATLTLPPGMTVNPPLAAGLVACTAAQLATEAPDQDPTTGCPQAAKIGVATVTTPLFATPITGSIYVASPDDNPFGSLLALYLVLRAPERGVLLSLPIRLDADPASGRLTATFDQIPALPLSHLALRFNAGPHAPLATPPRCGIQAIDYELAPSSGTPPLTGTDSFAINSECEIAFAPTLRTGSTSIAAGSEAPFVLDVANAPAAPNLSGLDLTLPPGLAADLTVAGTCPEADTAAASCPPVSRLGYARIALGAGPEPLWVPSGTEPDSAVYLAGPYRGAPFSLLIRVPAQAGPFDLGTVVLRAPITISPLTAQATVHIDALPQILAGVPLKYRQIRLVVDRPGFIHNPTSCEPTQITGSATSISGVGADLAERFQAADCAALPFRPKLALHLSTGARNAHPALRAVLRSDSSQAGIAAAAFSLPPGELLDLHHLRALCPRELAATQCPAASRLGSARFWSPLTDAPLGGPIYLREPNDGLPDLIADLQGGGLHLVLHGGTATPAGTLRFRLTSLPDIPLTKAVINLAGGRRGIIVNSDSLCADPARGEASFAAHSGKRRSLRPHLRVRC